jgi:aminobenzoyl-glutamate utilization protein B
LSLSATTAPLDAPWHAWPTVACAGMSIGHKGLAYAVKAMATTMVDLYKDLKTVKAIQAGRFRQPGGD